LGIQEAQKGFNKQLEKHIKKNDYEEIKKTLASIINETLTEPRSGSLEGFAITMDILVSDYSKESEVVKNLIDMSSKDYSTIVHSINVMAFTLGYASYMNYNKFALKDIGLCALLHDVGKTMIDERILKNQNKLTEDEFNIMKTHTIHGFDILSQCNFTSKQIALSALEHHEKKDGSGYPNNKTKISQAAKIIGIIDCYEALTNDDRPYRSSMAAFDALEKVMLKEVNEGKYDKELFTQFVKSLAA